MKNTITILLLLFVSVICCFEYCEGLMSRISTDQTRFTVTAVDKKNGAVVVKEMNSITPKRKLLKSYIFKIKLTDLEIRTMNLKINNSIVVSNDIYKNSVGKYDRKFKNIIFKVKNKKMEYSLEDKVCTEFF